MKAIVYTKFGPPDVLRLEEVQKPVPADYEVLIQVHAATVSSEDPLMRRSPGLNGFIKPKKKILGFYLSGEVKAVGDAVKRFQVGDRVYASTGMRLGAYAEFICLPENGALAKIPDKLTFEEAVAIPNGALTALPFLRDQGKVKPGQKVLIYGASGAVGTAAVQLAKYYGANVTGVCSTDNLQLVESLGADRVIDYRNEDFTQSGEKYDLIFDTVGKSPFTRSKGSLNQDGIYLTTVLGWSIIPQMLWTSVFGKMKARITFTGLRGADKQSADLNLVNELIEAGQFKAVIDRSYRLDQITEAHQYVEKGHKKGNVIITLSSEAER